METFLIFLDNGKKSLLLVKSLLDKTDTVYYVIQNTAKYGRHSFCSHAAYDGGYHSGSWNGVLSKSSRIKSILVASASVLCWNNDLQISYLKPLFTKNKKTENFPALFASHNK